MLEICYIILYFFCSNVLYSSEIYTLSLHDALPICGMTATAPTGSPGGSPPCRNHRTREPPCGDRKSTRLNSSHVAISYAVFCLKKKNITNIAQYLYLTKF